MNNEKGRAAMVWVWNGEDGAGEERGVVASWLGWVCAQAMRVPTYEAVNELPKSARCETQCSPRKRSAAP